MTTQAFYATHNIIESCIKSVYDQGDEKRADKLARPYSVQCAIVNCMTTTKFSLLIADRQQEPVYDYEAESEEPKPIDIDRMAKKISVRQQPAVSST